jgi:23S rRNA (cytidine1920-2'-O)/16S rRNA (cytidine1409-2'-O)-methyltransferase
MARRARLDAELVRRKLARSREQAAALVAAGRVQVRGTVARKVAAMVDPADPVVVSGDDPTTDYVSRGGHKLAGALAAFAPEGLAVAGCRCLDAGASTGGFTDVLLRAGARRVVAVDVGYGQLAWPLRTDDRVVVLDRTNVRALTPDAIGGEVDLTVADLSFISLRLVLPALAACTTTDGDLVLMIKPQFEVGRDRVGAGGVVRDPELRVEAVLDVAAAAAGLGLGVAGVTASPLPGPSGNVEFFVWFRREAPPVDAGRVRAVVAAGPAGTIASAGPPEEAGPPRDLGVVVGADARKLGERATTTPRSRGLGDEDKEHP